MDVLEAIKTRRSIRKYKNKPVEWDKIQTIVQAGKLAPSAGNLQNYRFIIITEELPRKKIAEAALQQTWMENAPVHIAIIGEPEKAERYYGVRGERLYTIQNCAAVAENMILVAYELGLGSCWVGAFDDDKMSRALNLPEHVRTEIILTVGYPAETPEPPPKYRIEHLCWFERWGNRRRIPFYGWYSTEVEKQVRKGIKFVKEIAGKIKKK